MKYAPQQQFIANLKEKLGLRYAQADVFDHAVELSKDFIEQPQNVAALVHEWADIVPDSYHFRHYKKNPNILRELLETLGEKNLDLFDQAAVIHRYSWVDNEQHEMHKKVGLSEVIDNIIEQVEEAKAPSPAKGGETQGYFYMGRRVSWNKEFPSIPLILKSAFMKFATQASKESPQTKGKPKEDVLVTRLTSLSQLSFASPEDLCLPDDAFFEKLAGGKLMVKIPLKTVQEKRTLVVLLDDSGSMDSRVENVQNILQELFIAVETSNLRLLIAPFEYTRGKFFEVSNEAQIEEYKKEFTAGSGGDTYLGKILPRLFKEIASGEIDSFPLPNDSQLLIINDGQDPISHIPVLPLVIHAVTVADNNKDLLELCTRSKGEYINIG